MKQGLSDNLDQPLHKAGYPVLARRRFATKNGLGNVACGDCQYGVGRCDRRPFSGTNCFRRETLRKRKKRLRFLRMREKRRRRNKRHRQQTEKKFWTHSSHIFVIIAETCG